MRNFANYMILPELSLILECCKGEASVEDAICMKKTEISDDLYNPNYNIIVDFRQFVTVLDSTVRAKTIDFFNFLIGLNMNCRISILTTAPHQVVISVMLKELSTYLEGFRIEVFSTLKAAIVFLGIPIENIDLINNKILELNNNTA